LTAIDHALEDEGVVKVKPVTGTFTTPGQLPSGLEMIRGIGQLAPLLSSAAPEDRNMP
jgi:hypothetical protein